MFQHFLIVSEKKHLLLYLKITINTACYLDFKFGRFKELHFQHILDVFCTLQTCADMSNKFSYIVAKYGRVQENLLLNLNLM